MTCAGYTYYVMLMAKSMCTSLHHPLKLLLSSVFAMHKFKSAKLVSY